MYTYYSEKSWFLYAGYKYKWTSNYDVKGIGFAKHHLTKHGDEIYVVVDKEKYKLNTSEALDFIKENRTFFKAGKRGKKTTLGVVSKSLLDYVGS